MAYSKLKSCLACDSKKLRQVLNLKKQPLANSYLTKKQSKENKYELKVNCCLRCTHLQLSIAVDPKEIYKNYDYVSGTTNTYKKYMKKFFNLCMKNTSNLVYRNILASAAQCQLRYSLINTVSCATTSNSYHVTIFKRQKHCCY